MIPPSPQVFWCNRSGRMLNYNPEFRYEEYVDGVLENRNIEPEMELDSTDEFTTVNIIAIDKGGWAGFAGRTFSYFPPRTRYVIPADSIEPGVKGRLKTIRNKRGRVIRRVREPHLVKLSGWNHELHFNYTTRFPGEYAVSFTYTSSSGNRVPKLMTLRRMKINGHESGVIVMPQIRQKRMQESSRLRVRLCEGTNRFSLSTDPFLTSDHRGFNGEVAIKEMILIKLPEK